MEGQAMKLTDDRIREIQVERDPAGSSVELKIAASAGNDPGIVHLSREDARRLAALILYHAARLDGPQVDWQLPHPDLERRSA
jgi:hypothetical protein